jgi:hypothetical protein
MRGKGRGRGSLHDPHLHVADAVHHMQHAPLVLLHPFGRCGGHRANGGAPGWGREGAGRGEEREETRERREAAAAARSAACCGSSASNRGI